MEINEQYKQFIDSKEPVSSIQEKDWTIYVQYSESYKFLKDMPDPDRIDCYDIPYGEAPMQKLDIHHMKNDSGVKRPVIIFIHGGAWYTEDKSNTRFYATEWIKRGYTVVSINYRLVPEVMHPAQIEDCAQALNWIIQNISNYCGDPDKIAIIGHSAGAHLAGLLVAGKKWHKKYGIDIEKVKCWIPVSGVFDVSLQENYLTPMLGPAIDAMLGDSDKKDCSPVYHVEGDEPPCLILHGGDDWLVPRTNSIKLYNKLIEKGAKDVQLEVVPGYWHVNMMLGYIEEGHLPAKIINKYLAEKLPTPEWNKNSLNY